jgi:serine/threonine protein phosphatase PrpC
MDDTQVSSPVILPDQRMTKAEVYGFPHGRVGIYSTRCPEKDSANEDALAVVPFDESSGALVVADGMGGHAAGDVAAQIAIDAVVSAIHEAREKVVAFKDVPRTSEGKFETGIAD